MQEVTKVTGADLSDAQKLARHSKKWFSATFTRPLAESKFRQRMGKVIMLAKVHEENGLPPGHKHYVNLNLEASKICNEFCTRWNVTDEYVSMFIPALSTLRRLAEKPAAAVPLPIGSYVGLGLLGVFGLSILLGLCSGLFHGIGHLMQLLFGG